MSLLSVAECPPVQDQPQTSLLHGAWDRRLEFASELRHSSVLGMSSLEIIDLCSDEESESVDVDVKPNFLYSRAQMKASCETAIVQPKLEECATAQVFEENRISNIVNGGSNSSYIVDQGSTSANGFCPMSASHGSSVPLSRQFWKSGDYEVRCVPEPSSRNGNALRVHPKFLHSNATSHKWALGAIAELLDNAVDEVQNGATFVIVDRFTCSDGGDPALLIHDDGGGMDPESLRRCMSFGFSDKQSSSSIGQYGNGFKTSTMRLGADVIVFSRCMKKRKLTQSVGLLSYTFLRQTGSDDIVVPVVDYEFDTSTGAFERLLRYGEKQFSSNLSILLKWSPFATEEELLKEFNDIGHHGTKIVVYNLWFNDDGNLELDFESDAEDIFISGSHKRVQTNNATKLLNQKHIANRLHYSLRVYLSILYLHIPDRFRIMLRGKVVEPHNIVNDLNYLECIKYRPQVGGNTEAEVVTFIGFLQGAPNVNVHGFNVYHKNRLILPFWKVANNSYGKGRGVVGVLEANFIKPTHDKQDFEKSTLYQKLETRLKEMTYEYWDYHCHLIGYTHSKVVPRAAPLKQMSQPKACDGIQQVKMKCGTQAPSHRLACAGISTGLGPLKVDPDLPIADDSIAASIAETSQGTLRPSSLLSSRQQAVTASHAPKHSVPRQLAKDNVDSQRGLLEKRWYENHVDGIPAWKRQAIRSNNKTQAGPGAGQEQMQEIITMMQENKKLHSECLEYEEREKVLLLKEQKLRSQLQEVQQVYKNLLLELRSMDVVESEKL